jgi:predicted transcriptional regulator
MSKIIDENKELLARLEDLGLTEKEARVYIALLPRQNTGTSKLVQATGLHGQFVYDALARLEEMGLAQHVIQNGRKKFSAGSPERILSLAEEKKLSAQAVVKQLAARFQGAHEQSFEIYQGRNAFVAHEWTLLEGLPEDGAIYILGGGGDGYLALFGEEMEAYEQRRIEKRVRLRYLSTAGDHENFEKMLAAQTQYIEFRILPKPAHGVETDIYSDKIVFHLYGDPVVSFTFKNKTIAEGYQRFFDVLWDLSQ